MDFEIQFSDLTLLEANGHFADVCKIMSDVANKTGAFNNKGDWMIRSKVTILSPFGFAFLICHFYNNGKVYISEYMPSNKDLHNPDIRCLTYWCNEFGWKTPEPLPGVVESWLEFWKAEWDTHIIDSAYLDKRFGERKEMVFEELDEDEDLEDLS